ncbi:GNAT family N-acetyltransferase [Neobacillus sp. LXY-4]|uniref:GNAT family N-acetyltransferase n=1 Tax=Neobacillus sp. LXY-4 TaxID=3379826 RepID=UPI003EE27AA7
MKYISSNQWDKALWLRARKVYQEAFGEHSPKPEQIIQNMFSKQLCNLHIADMGIDVVAMALTGSIPGSKILLIDYLAVSKDLRRNGIGQQLFDYIKNWAMAQGEYESILLEVECEETAENLDRIRFWEKCGFVLKDDYVHHYIWVPEPYQAMVLDLKDSAAENSNANAKDLFKYISEFHKESFRRK